jgi:hypothetical protein
MLKDFIQQQSETVETLANEITELKKEQDVLRKLSGFL